MEKLKIISNNLTPTKTGDQIQTMKVNPSKITDDFKRGNLMAFLFMLDWCMEHENSARKHASMTTPLVSEAVAMTLQQTSKMLMEAVKEVGAEFPGALMDVQARDFTASDQTLQ